MSETLTPDTIFEEIFAPDGLLSKSLPSYEKREDQAKMARQIWEAFEEEQVCLFEAGTGIGKSLAYLIPALLWSYQTGEKIVISTYTISLQEQLMEKDIPFLLKTLGLDLQVVLAKGMGNYVCLRKLDEVAERSALFESEEEIDALLDWANKSRDGTKSDIQFPLSGETWGKVYAEGEACSYVKCPKYKQCYFFKARAKAQEASIIIVNHHLLMAHLLSDEKRAILPPFTRLIIDEAHHLEPVARNCLTQTLDRVELFRMMAKVHSDAHPEVSRLFYLRDLLHEVGKKGMSTRLGLDLPVEKIALVTKINETFDALSQQVGGGNENKLRLTSSHLESPMWKEKLTPAFQELKGLLQNYGDSLERAAKEIEDLEMEGVKNKAENALVDLRSVAYRLKETCATIDGFFTSSEDKVVRWTERNEVGSNLTLAKLDVAPFLQEKLFQPLKSAILCSATLTVAGGFDHIATNLGLEKKGWKEEVYPSPFDYKNRTRLFSFSDMPPPTAIDFTSEATKAIIDSLAVSNGGAFVLFTSYDMLHKCSRQIESFCKEKKLPFFKQGDLTRHLLLEKFKSEKNGVLLGADSFWEGVDVPGDSLRLVIIVKLPFPVPSDPLVQAKGEILKKEGKDPFNDDSVPHAVMKFKQGFGRLMRRSQDRGCVICLDNRLFTRSYGKVFLRSLPECVMAFNTRKVILEEMRKFYGA